MTMLGFHRPPEQAVGGDGPLAACERTIDSLRAKADFYERMARWLAAAIILASSLIPIAIIGSTQELSFLLGKLVPSLLAAIAAMAAGLLQIERPHERWKLYRGYQRQLEAERLLYQINVAPYDGDEDARFGLFATRIARLQLQLHEEWVGIVPISAEAAQRAALVREAHVEAASEGGRG